MNGHVGIAATIGLLVATPVEAGQIMVPGTATGGFGLFPAGATSGYTAFVPAISVTKPGTITIIYKSGLVNYGGGSVNANGGDAGVSDNSTGVATPLDESVGINSAAYPGQHSEHIGALIGAFIPSSLASNVAFKAVDGTKGLAPIGIVPNELFYVGTYHVISVSSPGTLYLGINDGYPADNSGSFVVAVSSP